MVKKIINYHLGKSFEVCIMSRRSSKRAGTRYNARGLGDDGRVGNFVETEMFIIFDDFVGTY